MEVRTTFLPTADRLSEMEVLNTVRDLNENICQAAVGLAEDGRSCNHRRLLAELKLIPLLNPASQPARGRDLTSLLQSYLCYRAVNTTSS